MAVVEGSEEPRRDLARRSVSIDRVAGLVERSLELAIALSSAPFLSVTTKKAMPLPSGGMARCGRGAGMRTASLASETLRRATAPRASAATETGRR